MKPESSFKVGQVVTERNNPNNGTYVVLSFQWNGEFEDYDVALLSQQTGKKAWLWAFYLVAVEENDETT